MNYSEQCAVLLKGASTAGPVSESEIQNAEAELGLRFPTPYRAFLSRYGAAMGEGFEVAGLFVSNEEAPPMWRNVVSDTRRSRKAGQSRLDKQLFPVSDDGLDRTYYLKGDGGDSCSVIAYGPGCDGEEVAASLEEFIVKRHEGEL
jgi:hypothetical protein